MTRSSHLQLIVRRWGGTFVLIAILLAALFVGARGDSGQVGMSTRVNRIAREVRCPTCQGLSAAESDAAAARAVRTEIQRRAALGETDAEIKSFLVSRYGIGILLKPDSSGIAGLVWVLPMVVFLIAAGGVVVAFRRWNGPAQVPTPEERVLVEEALRS